MQTKNININQAPASISTGQQTTCGGQSQQQSPLEALVLPSLGVSAHLLTLPGEVEGYGPYKPVPPPKPVPGGGCYSPPPYRLPPFPPHGEPAIPGSAAGGVALHTHSSKFPIEREVILSSTDKNSKIPILNEYKKRPKSAAAIAPEGPNKQIAWIEEKKHHESVDDRLILTRIQHSHSVDALSSNMGLEETAHHLYKAQPMQLHDSIRGSKQPTSSVEYRPAYRTGPDSSYMYNGYHSAASTGAVPRWTRPEEPPVNETPRGRPQHHQGRPPVPLPEVSRRDPSSERKLDAPVEQRVREEEERNSNQNNANNDAANNKDSNKDDKNKAFPSRTYHTIKDMLSSRFGSVKLGKDVNGDNSVNGAEASGKGGEVSQTTALNNSQSNSAEPSKNVNNSPRKMGRTPGDVNQIMNAEEYESIQRQRMLGGVIGPSRNYSGETRRITDVSEPLRSHGVDPRTENTRNFADSRREDQCRSYPADSRRGPEENNPVPGRRAMQNDQSMYGAARSSHQADNVQYQHHQKPTLSRAAQSYTTQLEQAGVYMKMRQNPNITQHDNSNSQQYSQQLENQQKAEDLRQNFQNDRRDISRPEGSGYATANVKKGSQALDNRRPDNEDDDDGGFTSNTNKFSREQSSRQSIDFDKQKIKQSENRQEEDYDDDEGGFTGGPKHQSSGQSSDYEKATQRSTGQSDSGRGSTVYGSGRQLGSGKLLERLDTSTESSESPHPGNAGRRDTIYNTGNDTEWVDIVESELRQIFDPKLHGLGPGHSQPGANSTLSESISSLTPPLPPLSPGGGSSPVMTPRNSSRYKHSASLPYGSKLEYPTESKSERKLLQQGGNQSKSHHSRNAQSSRSRSSKQNIEKSHRQVLAVLGSSKKDSKAKGLSASAFGLDTTDLTSTTTGLDSMLDGNTENNSSDDDLSTTIDATDAHTIRKQLEGLENMYSEVLKLLGIKKYGGRYQPSDPRIHKRRMYGSMSSLPSSVSSRPVRDKRRQDDRKKVKDMKGINKRFQRLESHVVTLARSVAHLSSEMRTQHLMIQEMENIRGEISALRTQTLAVRSQSIPRALNAPALPMEVPPMANPTRVKKLTKFFGDEPPLLRLFLKKLGYEKYASSFEQEHIGMVELPYLTEERLQKMGIPMGPRLRILQEAQVVLSKDKIYVV